MRTKAILPSTALLRAAAALAAVLSAVPAVAWQVEPRGRVTASPVETNAPVEEIVIRCRPDFVIGVVTPGKRLRPDREWPEEEALFDVLFDRVLAEVDGEPFRLGAGGSADEATLYLFPERRDAFLSALHRAENLVLSFDILPEDAKDGAGFETFAAFDAGGLGAALSQAGRACRRPDGGTAE